MASFVLLLMNLLFVNALQYDTSVKLEVYIESGCPVSQGFINNELNNVLNMTDIISILDYKYVPFGTSYRNNGTFICYDENECITDSIQLCSLYKLSDHITSITNGDTSLLAYPFISCKLYSID